MPEAPLLDGIHHLKLPVSDLERSIGWYQQRLGYETMFEFVEDGVLMGVSMRHPNGGPDLALRRNPTKAREAAGFDYFAIGVPGREAIDALAARFASFGESKIDVQRTPVGWVLLGIHDPDGHEVRFYTVPLEPPPDQPSTTAAGRGDDDAPRRRPFVCAVLVGTAVINGIWTSPAAAVIGGQADGSDHPYVGAHDATHCGRGFASGVLVSPTVYVMSGHGAHFCLDIGETRTRVTFDDVIDATAIFHEGTIQAHPDYAGPAKANDVAVVVFDHNVRDIAPARLPSTGLLDELGPQALRDQLFTTVGYGAQRITGGRDGGGPPTVDRASRGTRKSVSETYLSATIHNLHLEMHEDGATCQGDSGAPSLFEGTNLIAGITVGGAAGCRNMDEHQRLDTPSVQTFLREFVPSR